MLGESYQQLIDMFTIIDHKLKSPEMVAKEVEDKYIQQKLKVMKNIYNITENFIKKNDGVLYGGFALNALLPTELKFYDVLTLPDYDAFVSKPELLSKQLADELIKSDYGYTEVKHALHENTYKVFSNFESVADLTGMNKKSMQIISKKAELTKHNNKTIKVCSKDFLKSFAYFELCLPQGASYRWVKVYKRLLIFENQFPIKPQTSSYDIELEKYLLSDDLYPLYKAIKSYLVDQDVVFSGLYSLIEHLQHTTIPKKAKYMEVISVNPNEDLDAVINIIKETANYKVKVVTNNEYPDLMTVHVDIFVRSKSQKEWDKILTIFDSSNNCFAFFKRSAKKITTVYYELYKMYMRRFIYDDASNDWFIYTLTKQILSSNDNTEMRFTDDCYGYNKSMSAIKKSIWDNKKKILYYRP